MNLGGLLSHNHTRFETNHQNKGLSTKFHQAHSVTIKEEKLKQITKTFVKPWDKPL